MKFILEVNCDNDAFQPRPEIELSYILTRLAQRLEDGKTYGSIRDTNGQTVGEYEFTQE